MHMLLFLLFGLVVGAVARWMVPGKEPGGWAVTMIIGIVGSFLGAYIGQFVGLYSEGQPAGFIMSVLGAIALVLGYRALGKRGWAGKQPS
jgi:uncharacterized membrane protein YeaQ/YmgE (transglycosylase-associated protein family)